MSIGAVTVNFNTGAHLTACVDSLKEEGVDRIVVADNGSTDDSLTRLADAHPDVKVVSLPHNPGYGAGNNAAARELDTDYLFVVNPDTVVQPGAIALLEEALASDPRIAVAGPRLVNADGSLYPSARAFPSFFDAVGHAVAGSVAPSNRWSRRYKMLDLDRTRRSEVDWVSGAAMLIRRDAWEAVGGFDDAYWMYMEDVDLNWRLRRAGWKVVYEPEAVVMHVKAVSTGQAPYKLILAHHRSLLRYYTRTAEGPALALLPVVVAGIALRAPLVCLQRFAQDIRRR